VDNLFCCINCLYALKIRLIYSIRLISIPGSATDFDGCRLLIVLKKDSRRCQVTQKVSKCYSSYPNFIVVSCVLVRILSHPAPARLSRRRTDARGAKVRVPVPVLSLARTQLGVWTQTDRPTDREKHPTGLHSAGASRAPWSGSACKRLILVALWTCDTYMTAKQIPFSSDRFLARERSRSELIPFFT
jgi:hypothetical protein